MKNYCLIWTSEDGSEYTSSDFSSLEEAENEFLERASCGLGVTLYCDDGRVIREFTPASEAA